ncbi:MAG: thiamine pyrophosphate-binding protein [Sideroxydans sp.]|nr:thiamine pyrophosphate-binding protein [Sideroxydans sp.]
MSASRFSGTTKDRTDHFHAHPIDVADLLVAYLEQIGIEYVFGIPGGAIEPLYNALARSERRGGIRHILARHESGAAFMADGYARESGKIGVCCATSGPGATNLITGVACAYDNDVPMLVITGQPALPSFGKNPLQDSSCTGINTLSMFRHCTRYNSLVSHPKQLEAKLISALQSAVRAPRGPSHLTFPVDVFRSPSPTAAPSYDLRGLLAPSSLVDEQSIATLQEALDQAMHVVILIGGSCGEAIGSILQFASMKGTEFVTTPDGKGLVNPRHPLFRGVFGFGGHASAVAALRAPSVDLVLAIGTSMGEWNSGGWCESVLNEKLIHIDESEEHLSHTPMARQHVRGRILSIFNRIVEQLQARQCNTTFDRQHVVRDAENNKWTPLHMLDEPEKYAGNTALFNPQRLMRELGTRFPPTTRFLSDTGNSTAWSVHYLHPHSDQRFTERRLGGNNRKIMQRQRRTHGGWLRVTMNFAAMGWAIGGAIGTAKGAPNAPVVCITGDGSMLMNGQELSVAVAEGLNIIFVVLNDQSLGMVKHGQRLAGAEAIGCTLPPTDFVMLARALGAQGFTLRRPEDMDALDINALCSRNGPTLLDVHIDPEAVPPMNVRMRVLANAL